MASVRDRVTPSTGRVAGRLAALGLALPAPCSPRGSYVPFVVTGGNLVFIAGQGPRRDGELLFAGKLGAERSVSEGYEAARFCALNLLAHLQVACSGDLDRVRRVVRVAGLVAYMADFSEHPRVVDGASDLLHAVFEVKGRHARMASGAVSLPSNMTVEVESCFEIDGTA